MKIRIIGYQKHKDHIGDILDFVADELSKFNIEFNDITIYTSTKGRIVDKKTGAEINVIVDDDTLNHKNAFRAGRVKDTDTYLYDFYGINLPSTKTKHKKRKVVEET